MLQAVDCLANQIGEIQQFHADPDAFAVDARQKQQILDQPFHAQGIIMDPPDILADGVAVFSASPQSSRDSE